MSIRFIPITCFVISLFAFPINSIAKETDVDYLSLAAILIKDGHFDRAESALKTLESNEINEGKVIQDKARFYTLKGLVLLKKQDFENAKTALKNALNHGQQDPIVYIYLAQAAYRSNDYSLTINAIDQAGVAAKSIKELYTMKAQSYWKLNKKTKAWQTLLSGLRQFPDEAVFQRQQIFLLLELKLYQHATNIGNNYLNRKDVQVEEYLAIGSALRKSKQLDKAISILEKAKLLFPTDKRVSIELAHAYLDSDKTLAAAEIFQQVANLDSEYISEASELFRRAGKLHRALNLNAQVREQEKKLKQRLAILLEYEDYELAAAMKNPLYRVGLLEDQDIRYASAYSLFKAGKYADAADQLNHVKRPDLFRKSAELRKLMQQCENSHWACN